MFKTGMVQRQRRSNDQPPGLPRFTFHGFQKLSPPFEASRLLTNKFELVNKELRGWFEQHRTESVPEETVANVSHNEYIASKLDRALSLYDSDCFVLRNLPVQIMAGRI